jgi:hypothetical protein
MVETAEQYQARLAAYTEGKDPIAMQRQAPHTLAQLIEGVAEAQLSLKPAPGKWSVTEILAHLAERGRLIVQELCRHMAAHDINHINQVRSILGG